MTVSKATQRKTTARCQIVDLNVKVYGIISIQIKKRHNVTHIMLILSLSTVENNNWQNINDLIHYYLTMIHSEYNRNVRSL